jgi:hypothetical protein
VGRLAEQQVGERGGARRFGRPRQRAALQGAARPAQTLARCAVRRGGNGSSGTREASGGGERWK